VQVLSSQNQHHQSSSQQSNRNNNLVGISVTSDRAGGVNGTINQSPMPQSMGGGGSQHTLSQQNNYRNENILCAVLALLKELDESGLELVKRDIDRKLQGKKQGK